jgi:glycosyltransferase involved in cell wall biosynthesis
MGEYSRKPKLLHVCGSTAWGGLEMQMVSLAEQLSARTDGVRCVVHPEGRIASECVARGLPVIPLQLGRYLSSGAVSRLRGAARRLSVDLIHCHLSQDLWSIIPATLGLGIPVVLTKAIGSYVKKKDPLHRWLYGRVSRVIAISDVIRRNVIDTCPIAPGNVVTIYPGVDVERFTPGDGVGDAVRARLGIEDGVSAVGIVGRLEPWKGQLEFIEAAALVHREHPRTNFIVAGADTTPGRQFRRFLEQRVSDLGLQGSVVFTGHVSDVASLLRALDVFVFPYRAEAFGLALAEAMATGIACIAAKAEGVEEIVEDQTDGLLFSPGDVQEMARSISLVLSRADVRKALAERAREKVAREFSLGSMVERVMAIYGEVL